MMDGTMMSATSSGTTTWIHRHHIVPVSHEIEASRKGVAQTFVKFSSGFNSGGKHEDDKEHDGCCGPLRAWWLPASFPGRPTPFVLQLLSDQRPHQ